MRHAFNLAEADLQRSSKCRDGAGPRPQDACKIARLDRRGNAERDGVVQPQARGAQANVDAQRERDANGERPQGFHRQMRNNAIINRHRKQWHGKQQQVAHARRHCQLNEIALMMQAHFVEDAANQSPITRCQIFGWRRGIMGKYVALGPHEENRAGEERLQILERAFVHPFRRFACEAAGLCPPEQGDAAALRIQNDAGKVHRAQRSKLALCKGDINPTRFCGPHQFLWRRHALRPGGLRPEPRLVVPGLRNIMQRSKQCLLRKMRLRLRLPCGRFRFGGQGLVDCGYGGLDAAFDRRRFGRRLDWPRRRRLGWPRRRRLGWPRHHRLRKGFLQSAQRGFAHGHRRLRGRHITLHGRRVRMLAFALEIFA